MLMEYIGRDVEIVTLRELGITDDPEETGATFEDNALLKARYYFDKMGIPALADDGGVEIDALGGAPGVHSRRWMGRVASDQELIDYTLEQMKDVAPPNRMARFSIALCFYPNAANSMIVKDSTLGYVATQAHITPEEGFPYRALFVVEQFNKLYDELTPVQHKQVNHRDKALAQLAPHILSWYNTLVESLK